MKKHFFIFTLSILISVKAFSQINFEKGYFINKYDQKIECFIKNEDWANNPAEFEYKISLSENSQKATIQNTKEFAIYGASKYVKASVKIDRSGSNLDDLSKERDPFFQDELLFLKVVLEGKASLFLYRDGNLIRYFYKFNNSEFDQLIYKQYYINSGNISENNHFRSQLSSFLKCNNITIHDLKSTRYNKKDLEKVFIKYNECTNSTFISYNSKEKKDFINLTIRPGYNSSSLSVYVPDDYFEGSVNFESDNGFRLGIEAELILPFNKNKWRFAVEPTYQSYKSETSEENYNVLGAVTRTEAKITYESIEIPLSLRHYLYLNDNSSFFINFSYVLDFANDSSSLDYEIVSNITSFVTQTESLKLKSETNIGFGMGYKYKNYSVEIRYLASREIIGNYALWGSNYRTLSFILGYSLF